MIQRRSFIMGVCSVVATLAVVSAASIMPIRAANQRVIETGADRAAGSVVFTIHGWNGNDLATEESNGQFLVPIYLPNSWRSSWH
jgi:hypothetical protein